MRSSIIVMTFLIISCATEGQQPNATMTEKKEVKKSESEWKAILTPEQYNVCRLGGTELPGSGKYDKFFEAGYYNCAACGARLFESGTKFNSGTGWPSFYDAYKKSNLSFHRDTSYGMIRTEVNCASCGSHLGHVFDDGPDPTGLRYCINSLALEFVPASDKQ